MTSAVVGRTTNSAERPCTAAYTSGCVDCRLSWKNIFRFL